MSDRQWHYLEVNRGRYLCAEHGGFCDSSDGYSKSCPLCSEKTRAAWVNNNLDRTLQIVKNLQSRSQRSLAVVITFVGAFGIAKLFDKQEVIGGVFRTSSGWLLSSAVFLMIMAIGLYLLSMGHISVVPSGRFEKKTLAEWEEHFAKKLRTLEKRHNSAGGVFAAALLIAFVGIAFPDLPSKLHAIFCGVSQ